MAGAPAMVGLDERVMQRMAEAGDIPGAIKIRGAWTFEEKRLRNWLAPIETKESDHRKKARRRKAPPNTEWHGDTLYGRIRIKGNLKRWSLRTGDVELARQVVAA